MQPVEDSNLSPLKWLRGAANWHPLERAMMQRRAVSLILEGYPRRIAWAMAMLQVQNRPYVDEPHPAKIDLVFARSNGNITVDALVGDLDIPGMTSPRLHWQVKRLLPKLQRVVQASKETRAGLEAAVCQLVANAIPGVWIRPVFMWDLARRA